MTPCCYILYSKKLSKYYIGFTSQLDLRLEFHKQSESRKFTSKSKDWELYYKITCESQSQALAIESHIKRMKSKVYLKTY